MRIKYCKGNITDVFKTTSFDAEVQGAVADNSYDDGEWSINIGLTHLGFTLSRRMSDKT